MSEPTFAAVPDNRVIGGPNPAGDVNQLADLAGLYAALFAVLFNGSSALPIGGGSGNTTDNNNTNIQAIIANLTSTATMLLSSQLGAAGGVAPLDTNSLVPVANLPSTSQPLWLPVSGTPSNSVGFQNDYIIDPTTGLVWGPKGATAWPGSPAGQLIGSVSGWTGPLPPTRQFTTGLTPYTFTTGGGNISGLTWTAPNDGFMHRVVIFAYEIVTTTTVGGALNCTYTDPGNNLRSGQTLIAGNITAPANKGLAAGGTSFLVYPDTAFTVTQAAMSSGAATGWVEGWAS
jgi:hypothetical protein